ncbi:MAG: serine hydrolase domain-containing protein [Acidimicrobiales bacterium]
MHAFEQVTEWPQVDRVAAAIVAADGSVERFGPTDEPFALASISKLFTAMAVLVAHEEGTLPLDEIVTPGTSATDEGATVADLLAHSGGIAPDEPAPMTLPRTRRIYSTAAYDMLADRLAERAGIEFSTYLHEAVAEPLALTSTRLDGSAGAGMHASVDDLVRLAAAWTTPLLVDRTTLDRATRPHLPELAGVLPGFGRQDPNPWGLGPEIRGHKQPHWTAPQNSPGTYGHFGQTGTMLWIDPEVDITAIVLTDRPFGPWAADTWPVFSAAVLAGHGNGPNDPGG